MIRIKTLLTGAMALVAALMALSAPGAANAQGARPEGQADIVRGWNLRLGMFIFNNKAARDKSGSIGISGLAERTVYETEKYEINVGAGYNGFGNVYSVPITVTGIMHHGNIRYGGAFGYAFGKRVSGRGMSGILLGLLGGYQLTPGVEGINADIRYNFISGADSELDGFSITLGKRF